MIILSQASNKRPMCVFVSIWESLFTKGNYSDQFVDRKESNKEE